MDMKKINILLAACVLAATATAQNVELTSRIKGTDGQPVNGAIVSIVGANVSALSDEEGLFTLAVDDKNALVRIQAEGFYGKEYPLSFLKKLLSKIRL